MKAQRVTFPVQSAPANATGPVAIQPIRHRSSDVLAIQLGGRRSPWVLMAEVLAHVLPAPGEIMTGTGFEHDNTDAAPGQLERQDAASGTSSDDADVGFHRGYSCYPALRTRAGIACEVGTPPGEGIVSDSSPPRRRAVIATDQVGHGPGPDITCVIREGAEDLIRRDGRGDEPVARDERDTLAEVEAREPGPGQTIEQRDRASVDGEIVKLSRRAVLDVINEVASLYRGQYPTLHQHSGERHEVFQFGAGQRPWRFRTVRRGRRPGGDVLGSPTKSSQTSRRVSPEEDQEQPADQGSPVHVTEEAAGAAGTTGSPT